MKYTIWIDGHYWTECSDIVKATYEIKSMIVSGIEREAITAFDENGHEKLQNVR